jgi:catechol 2,3-dioxygenase-like lactoylglutathione lyase family enzyme
MSTVSVRYIVDNVDAAIPFYTEMLGFKVDMSSRTRVRESVQGRVTIAAQPARCRRRRTTDA